MTVGGRSCDSGGDAGCAPFSGQIPSGQAALLALAALGSLGSRFWALVEDGSDSDDEVVAKSKQFLSEGQGGSPIPLPA
jgi:hypothetical protein